MYLNEKIDEYRDRAAAIEDWAQTVIYPDIQRSLFELAKQWREMAARFERVENIRVRQRAVS
jgi:hypothetical protein